MTIKNTFPFPFSEFLGSLSTDQQGVPPKKHQSRGTLSILNPIRCSFQTKRNPRLEKKSVDLHGFQLLKPPGKRMSCSDRFLFKPTGEHKTYSYTNGRWDDHGRNHQKGFDFGKSCPWSFGFFRTPLSNPRSGEGTFPTPSAQLQSDAPTRDCSKDPSQSIGQLLRTGLPAPFSPFRWTKPDRAQNKARVLHTSIALTRIPGQQSQISPG